MSTRSKASRSRSSSLSMASRSRKRRRTSPEQIHYQGRHEKNDPLHILASMLMTDTVLTTKELRPVKEYVKAEKYIRLKEKYNKLLAEYEAAQERYRLTLQCLGSLGDSGVESDVTEEHNAETQDNIENIPEEHNGETTENIENVLEGHNGETTENIGNAPDEYDGETTENIENISEEHNEVVPETNNDEISDINEESEGDYMPSDDDDDAPEADIPNDDDGQAQEKESDEETDDVIVNTDTYITKGQWETVLRCQSVKLFVENTLNILFKKDTLLASTELVREGDDTTSVAAGNVLDKIRIQVLRVLLDRYLEESKERKYNNEEKEKARKEWTGHVNSYITRLRQNEKESLYLTLTRDC